MALEFTVSDLIPAPPQAVYDAWLDSASHSAMTGGSPAKASPEVGGEFSAWDGYLWGRNLALEPGRRILQSWRTTEFEKSDPDSLLEVLFEDAEGGTRITIHHSNLSDAGEKYREGWVDAYLDPMKAYFRK